MRRVALIVCLAACAACTSRATPEPVMPRQKAPSEIEKHYPGLRWVPPHASYMVTAAHTVDAVRVMREIAGQLVVLPGFGLADVETWARQNLGISPLSADDLAQAGIALDRGMALFSSRLLPTLVLPVEDEDKLDQFLRRAFPQAPVVVRRFGSQEWFTWKFGGGWALMWTRWPGHIAVHLAVDRGKVDMTWLRDIHEPEPHTSRTTHSALDRSTGETGTLPAIFGYVSPDLFSAVTQGFMEHGAHGARAIRSCQKLLAPLDGPVALGMHLAWPELRLLVDVPLQPAAKRALMQHRTPPPPGFAGYRTDAGVYASWAVNLAWLLEGVTQSGCPIPRALGLSPGLVPRQGPVGGHVAIKALDLDKLKGDAAIHVNVASPEYVKPYLDLVPQRSLLEKKAQVAGQSVRVVKVPFLTSFVYRLDGSGFTGATDLAVMEKMLTAPRRGNPKHTAELAAVAVYPQRFPDLGPLLDRAGAYLSLSSYWTMRLSLFLAYFEHLTAHARLQGDHVTIELSAKPAM